MLNLFHCFPVKVFLKKVRSSRKATPFVLILELPHFNTQHEQKYIFYRKTVKQVRDNER